MTLQEIYKLFNSIGLPNTFIYSLNIPDTKVTDFVKGEIDGLGRLNSLYDYQTVFASNHSFVTESIGSFDFWTKNIATADKFKQLITQKINETEKIYMDSSSIAFDEDVEAYRVTIKFITKGW